MSISGQGMAQSVAQTIRKHCEELLEELNSDPSMDAAEAVKTILELAKKIEAEAKSGWY